MSQFVITGNKKLSGEIMVNSSKNAATACIIASLINRGVTRLKNVPQIEEVNRLVEVLVSIGVSVDRSRRELVIRTPKKFLLHKIDYSAAHKTRSIILAIGALAGRVPSFKLPRVGGCKIGSRTINPHLFALSEFGIKVGLTARNYEISIPSLKASEVVLYETGDTVTENALMAASQINGKSVIKMASANYMVQDLCAFLEKMGVQIKWVGSGSIQVQGKARINKDITYQISPDPIEAMMFLSIGIVTKSNITIRRCPFDFLELELLKLEKMGLKYKILNKYKSKNKRNYLADIKIYPSELKALADKIHAMPFPGINQDNLPFFVPIATQAKGKTMIHDWTYENRAIYYSELNRLGANVTLMDPHRVNIEGPTMLKATEMVCPPALRPAAIILVAMLAAKGKSILRNVYPIHRGYERLEQRLGEIGADIRLEG